MSSLEITRKDGFGAFVGSVVVVEIEVPSRTLLVDLRRSASSVFLKGAMMSKSKPSHATREPNECY